MEGPGVKGASGPNEASVAAEARATMHAQTKAASDPQESGGDG